LSTEGGHLSIVRGSFTVWYDRGCRLSGYDCEAVKETAIAAGLPGIDSRSVECEPGTNSEQLIAVAHAGCWPRSASGQCSNREAHERVEIMIARLFARGAATGVLAIGFAGGLPVCP
jgi:hypothetical protein